MGFFIMALLYLSLFITFCKSYPRSMSTKQTPTSIMRKPLRKSIDNAMERYTVHLCMYIMLDICINNQVDAVVIAAGTGGTLSGELYRMC